MDKMQEGLKRYKEKVLSGEIKVLKRPSMSKAIRAKCADCMNNFADGRLDCELEKCSLYYFMPYSARRKEERRLKKLQNEKNNINKK